VGLLGALRSGAPSTSALTLPSKGRPTAGHTGSLRHGQPRRWPPLMSNVRALVRTRSIAFMHYGRRKALRIRFLLISRYTALRIQLPQRAMAFGGLASSPSPGLSQHRASTSKCLNALWPVAGSRARFLLFSRNTALHAAAQSAGSTRTAHWAGSVRQCHARRALSSPSPLGAYSSRFSRAKQILRSVGTSGVAHSAAFRSSMNQCPNPSIEGTSNGGAHWFAPSRSATPLAAPHVKR
jgi:hypothetical protein